MDIGYIDASRGHGEDCAVTNDALLAIATNRSHLRKLNAEYSRGLTDITPLSQLVHLTDLDVSGCPGATDAAMVVLADESRAMQHLAICGTAVGDVGVDDIVAAWGNTLGQVNVRGCDKVTGAGVLALARGCGRLTDLVYGSDRVYLVKADVEAVLASAYCVVWCWRTC